MSELSDSVTPEQVYVDLAESEKKIAFWKRMAKGWEKSRDEWLKIAKERLVCIKGWNTAEMAMGKENAILLKRAEEAERISSARGHRIIEAKRKFKELKREIEHQGEQIYNLLEVMDEMYWYLMREGKQWSCPICGAEDDCKEGCIFDKYCKVISEIKVDRGEEKTLSMPNNSEKDVRIDKLKNETKEELENPDWKKLQNFADKGVEHFLHHSHIVIALMWLNKEIEMIKEK